MTNSRRRCRVWANSYHWRYPRYRLCHAALAAIAPDAVFPKLRYWIIVNNIVREQPVTVQLSWTAVMSRANKATYKHLIIEPMNLLASNARLIKERYDIDVELNWVAIPREFAFADVSNEFDPRLTIPWLTLSAMGPIQISGKLQ